jgi:hypothetical protein
LLEKHFPDLPHAAARIGPGSDVLGFDTPMSMDHDWGYKLVLFLADDSAGWAGELHDMLTQELPFEFMGFPTGFTPTGEEGTAVMQGSEARPLNHAVQVTTPRHFFGYWLGWDGARPLTVTDWLAVSAQTLRELTTGAVYHDGFGALSRIRKKLAWYPHDIWLYLMACTWQRISQDEHLMPRAGYVGDELGSAIIGSRLVRDVMTLGFLMEKQYPPYPKWFGTAFEGLDCAGELSSYLRKAQQAPIWQERQQALGAAFQILASRHNALGLTASVSESLEPFHDRPFQVIGGERFVEALMAKISDPAVLATARLGLVGSVDTFSDSTDLRSHIAWRDRLRCLLDPDVESGA